MGPRQLLRAVDTRTIIVLLVVATAFRAGFLIADSHPANLAGLSAGEGEVARNIVDHGEWFVIDKRALRTVDALQVQRSTLIDPSSFDYTRYDARPHRVPELVEPLGPALILAAFWAVTGDHSYIWLQLLQLVLGVGLTIIVVWLSLSLFKNPRAAMVAGLLWAASPTLSYLGILPLYEVWAVFFTFGVVAMYVFVRQRESFAVGLPAVGLLIGLGTLFRQGVLLLLPVLVLVEFGFSGRRALRAAAYLSVGCLVVIIPWTLRNLHEFDELRPTNGVGGQVLWEALGENTATFGAVYSDGATLRAVHASRPDLEYGTSAYDSYLRSKALKAIAEHPVAYAELILRRSIKSSLLNVSPWPRSAIDAWNSADEQPLEFAVRRPLATAELAIATLIDPLLFIVAVITTVALRHGPMRRELLLLWLVWASVLLVPVLISGSHSRYMAPGLPMLIIVAGLGVDMLIRKAADRRVPLLPRPP